MSRARFSDLGRRVGTAAVGLPLLLAGLLLGPPLLAVAIVAAAVLLGASELFTLLAKGGIAPMRAAGFLAVSAVFVDVARPGLFPASAWPAVAVVVMGAMLVRSRDISLAVPAAAGTLLGAAYLGGLGGSIAALRVLPPVELGAWRLLLLLAIVMGADTAAFFVGSAIGRRKLAPAISPGKITFRVLAANVASAVAPMLISEIWPMMHGIPAASAKAMTRRACSNPPFP